jgi:hypothetical protein
VKNEESIEKFHEIFHEYIINDGEKTMNINRRIINSILERIDFNKPKEWIIEENPKEILIILQKSVINDLYVDNFPRYLRKQSTHDLICTFIEDPEVISKTPESCVEFKLKKSFYGSEMELKELLSLSFNLANRQPMIETFFKSLHGPLSVNLILMEKKTPFRPLRKVKEFLSPLVSDWFEPETYQCSISIGPLVLGWNETELCIPQQNFSHETIFSIQLSKIELEEEMIEKLAKFIIRWNTKMGYSTKSKPGFGDSKNFFTHLIKEINIDIQHQTSMLITNIFLNLKKFVPSENFRKKYKVEEFIKINDHYQLDSLLNSWVNVDPLFEDCEQDLNYLKSMDRGFWMKYEASKQLLEEEHSMALENSLCNSMEHKCPFLDPKKTKSF